MSAVTILSGPERRRRWSSAEKLRIVAESRAPGANVAAVARRHDVHPNLLHLWRRQARTGVLAAAPGGEARFAPVIVAADGGSACAAAVNRGALCMIEVVLRNGRVLRVPSEAARGRWRGWRTRWRRPRDDADPARRTSVAGDRPHRHAQGF